MANVIPTKGNLMAIKRSLSLAHLGFDLMDRKRNILIREMMQMIDTAKSIQDSIDATFTGAYEALRDANITLGQIGDLARGVDVDESLGVRYRSVMGVEIPIVAIEDTEPAGVPYGLAFSNAALDKALLEFLKVKRFICQLAEVETSIYRLAVAIKKTQKRANALQNIIIPNFSADVKFIVEALEEKEREEFVRLKVIKGNAG